LLAYTTHGLEYSLTPVAVLSYVAYHIKLNNAMSMPLQPSECLAQLALQRRLTFQWDLFIQWPPSLKPGCYGNGHLPLPAYCCRFADGVVLHVPSQVSNSHSWSGVVGGAAIVLLATTSTLHVIGK
jgi:hypothetical protein